MAMDVASRAFCFVFVDTKMKGLASWAYKKGIRFFGDTKNKQWVVDNFTIKLHKVLDKHEHYCAKLIMFNKQKTNINK